MGLALGRKVPEGNVMLRDCGPLGSVSVGFRGPIFLLYDFHLFSLTLPCYLVIGMAQKEHVSLVLRPSLGRNEMVPERNFYMWSFYSTLNIIGRISPVDLYFFLSLVIKALEGRQHKITSGSLQMLSLEFRDCGHQVYFPVYCR